MLSQNYVAAHKIGNRHTYNTTLSLCRLENVMARIRSELLLELVIERRWQDQRPKQPQSFLLLQYMLQLNVYLTSTFDLQINC